MVKKIVLLLGATLCLSPLQAHAEDICEEFEYQNAFVELDTYLEKRDRQLDRKTMSKALRWTKQCAPEYYQEKNLSAYLFPDSYSWRDQRIVSETGETLGYGVEIENEAGYRLSLACAVDNMAELILKLSTADAGFPVDYAVLSQYANDLQVGMSFGNQSQLEASEPWVLEDDTAQSVSTSLDYDLVQDKAIIDALQGRFRTEIEVKVRKASSSTIETTFSLSGSRDAIDALLKNCHLN